MKTIFFTLYEKEYHFGVAALINSCIRSGFPGEFHVGYRDRLPPWVKGLRLVTEDTFEAGGLRIRFFACDPRRHLGYHKPFAALDILERNPDAEAIVYADPDVLCLARWTFFEQWLRAGVAICVDCNFTSVSEHHPWRAGWRILLAASGRAVVSPDAPYANSGYIGVERKHVELLRVWCDATLAFEMQGGDTARFRLDERHESVTGDQDLLAAALMAVDMPLSLLGPEGMGFNGDFRFLCHVVEQPKPWVGARVARAIRGRAPSHALTHWRRQAVGPIRFWSPPRAIAMAADLFLAKLIGRIIN